MRPKNQKKVLIKTLSLYFVLTFMAFLFSCKKDDLNREAKVETKPMAEVMAITAKATGDIIDLGTGITDHGHCWSLTAKPTITDNKTSLGTAFKAGDFISNIQNLGPGKTYYVRAYVKSGIEVMYGIYVQFITLNGLATLTTRDVTNITINSATIEGDIVSVNGDVVLARGICWDTLSSVNLTKKTGFTQNGSGLGPFQGEIAGLIPGKTYYVKAWAITNIDTTYGESKKFTTLNGLATLTTTSISSITSISATCGGEITYDGGASITSKGVCWSTTQNPTKSNNKTIDGSGNGPFTSSITGLSPGVNYYVRAYATNSVTTSYGNQQSLTAKNGLATVTTTTISQISATTVVSGGIITEDGGSPILERGICWGATQNPTTLNSKTINGSGIGAFISNIEGLMIGQTYYLRAYATNNITTSYGTQQSFTMKDGTSSIITNPISNLTANSATCGGEVLDDAGFPIIDRGVCWSILPNPTISDSKKNEGLGKGSFVSNITGLKAAQVYYIRSYATNAITSRMEDQLLQQGAFVGV
jgi:hypothetical protein